MKKLAIEQASMTLKQAAHLAKNDLVVLTENGKPRLVMVSVKDDLAVEALALSRNRRFMNYLDECRERVEQQGGYTLREIKEEFGLSDVSRRVRKGRRHFSPKKEK